MKFTCNQIDLMVAINAVSKSISNRSSMPILKCMLLKVENDELYLIGTDLELGIKSKIKANIQQSGMIALDTRLFTEIIRRLPEDEIEISSDESNYATIKYEKSEYKIAGQSGEEYPELPIVEKKNAIVMFQDELKDMIKSTIFAIATEETKPVLIGELLEIEGNTANLVAVDGFRIAYKKGTVNNNAQLISAIIPGKNLNELSKILSQEKDLTVNIYLTDRNILFELEDSIVVSRLIEGKFINYKQNLVDNSETTVTINRISFLESVERISLISGIDKKQPISLSIQDDYMTISTVTVAGTGHEEVAIKKSGSDLKIAFNPKYLLDVLRVAEDEEIVLTFNTPLSPCIIKAKTEEKYKYLILPLRA